MTPTLCIDCRFYKAGDSEDHDTCTHEQAQYGQVRRVQWYPCTAMRAGICRNGALFEAREAEAA